MKYILKNPEPPGLIAYRQTPNASYQGLRKKKTLYRAVKKSLVEEQGFICCYCGRRITGGADSQIEHIYAKGTPEYEEMQLDYESNFLACCDGGKGERAAGNICKADLYCEAVKGSIVLPITPLNPVCEEVFIFSDDGEALGINKAAEVTLKILNLNSPAIKTMRKYAIDNYSLFPVADWKAEMNRLKSKDSNGQFEEFCFVLKSYIEIFHGDCL